MLKMSLKILTDENISPSLVNALRSRGYDVKDIKEEKLFGISDIEALNLAFKESKIKNCLTIIGDDYIKII